MQEAGLDSFLITNPTNIRYITGFSGTADMSLVTLREAYLVIDFRYRIQARSEVDGFEILERTGKLDDFLVSFLGDLDIRGLGFESTCTYRFAQQLKRMTPHGVARPTENILEKARMIKDPEEIAIMEELIGIAVDGFSEFSGGMHPDVTEKEASLELEIRIRKKGSGPPPFPIIVASGENAAMPHALASDRMIGRGEPVIIDFGTSGRGYCTDMTRTVSLDSIPADIAKAYSVVYDAQRSAIDVIRPGVTAGAVDRAARSVIEEAGMGEMFGHATGHGVGLEVHESPRLAQGSSEVLLTGMILTVEPGIYMEGRGGVRIEDMVLVTENGSRVLTKELPKESRLDS